jgi:hypothetical protein
LQVEADLIHCHYFVGDLESCVGRDTAEVTSGFMSAEMRPEQNQVALIGFDQLKIKPYELLVVLRLSGI